MPISLSVDSASLTKPPWPEVTASDLACSIDRAIDAARAAVDPESCLDVMLETLVEGLPELRTAVFGVNRHFVWSITQHGYAFVPDGLVDDPETESRSGADGLRFIPDVAGAAYTPIDPRAVSAVTVPLLSARKAPSLLVLESVVPLPANTPVLVAPLAREIERLYDAALLGWSFDAGVLARVLVQISTLRDPRAIAEIAVLALRLALPLETAQVSLFAADGATNTLADWRSGDARPLPESAVAILRSRIAPNASLEVLRPGDPDLSGVDDGRAILWLPLRAGGNDIGVLAGTSRWLREIGNEPSSIAVLLTKHVSASLDATLMLGRERLSALTDPLTGIANRRGFEQRLESELAAAIESGRALSLLVLDCDDFKDVNDRAGHAFGDALLQEAAIELEATVGESGIAARLGGDEFVVMLPGSDRDAATRSAEEIRRRLARGLADAGFPLRMSVGVATCPYDGVGSSQLLRAADQALYRAKEWGKDQVTSFREIAARQVVADESVESRDRRHGSRADAVGALGDIANAARLIWDEPTTEAVLGRLAKTASFVVGATGCVVSRIADGMYLYDIATHALRDTDLGPDWAYLIADFPLTEAVLRDRAPRTLSFLDPEIDPAEAYILRELGMSCVLLVPLVVAGEVFGLVELYDVRLRRFTSVDQAIASYLVEQAGHCIRTLGPSDGSLAPERPVWRLPGG